MIVADATPLIHLSRIGRLELLRHTFQGVIMPHEVYEEVVVQGEAQGRADALVVKEAVGRWMETRELSVAQREFVDALRRGIPLGQGEAACLALARDLRAPVVLDDSVAVRAARRLGLATYWTTSVILEAVSRGHLTRSEGREAVEVLVRSGLRVRPDVLVELLAFLRE